MSAICRSCKAPIRWARTPVGRAIPLDPDPRPDGNVRLGQVGGEEVALVLAGDELAAAQIEGPVYVSHFATCPNAAQHRKSESRGPASPEDSTATRGPASDG